MFQYYEMSYGLNVEMHKQVCTLIFLKYILFRISLRVFVNEKFCFHFLIADVKHVLK